MADEQITVEWIATAQQMLATIQKVDSRLDRQEKATENGQDVPYSAVQFVQRQLGLQVCSIAKLGDLMQYLAARHASGSDADHQRVLAYRQRYGVDEGDA